MKTKILITESQYKKLLTRINEQWSPTMRTTSKPAPAWLTAIIGNKEDGYTIDLPPSNLTSDVDEVINPDSVEALNKERGLAQEIAYKMGGKNTNGTHFQVSMLKTNPKYRAMIIKVYKNLKQSVSADKIKIHFNKVQTSTTTDPTVTPGTKKPFKYGFPLDDKLVSKKYFVDNSWELDPSFIELFRSTTLQKIKNELSKIPNAKGVLNGITVRTSCSTLPNGESPDNKVHTFAELSQLRNEAAKDFIVKELQSIGVTILPDLNYEDDWEGNLTGKYLGASSHSGDIWGQDGASKVKTDYESDKYLKILLDLSISGDKIDKTDPTKTPGDIKREYIYTVSFTIPDVPYRIPGIELAFIWNPKTKSKCKVDQNSATECFDWGGGPKDWSTNKNGVIHFGTED